MLTSITKLDEASKLADINQHKFAINQFYKRDLMTTVELSQQLCSVKL